MKLHLNVDAPEEGDPQSPRQAESAESILSPAAAEGIARIFEDELLALYPGAVRYGIAEISVSFPDIATMRDINRTYREIDEPTDVLSFPLWEDEGRFVPEETLTEFLPLGDIVICPEEAFRVHEPLSRSEILCLMLAHGFLHLLARDHDTPEKERDMQERQDGIKNRLLKVFGEIC